MTWKECGRNGYGLTYDPITFSWAEGAGYKKRKELQSRHPRFKPETSRTGSTRLRRSENSLSFNSIRVL